MKNKKNIERLFQESFKDFEVKPNDSVWGNLQNKLAEKQNSFPYKLPKKNKIIKIIIYLYIFFINLF